MVDSYSAVKDILVEDHIMAFARSIIPAVIAVTVVGSSARAAESASAFRSFGGEPGRPRLYDNTDICTPNLHWLALGGKPPAPMYLRDWFTTVGGEVRGFDLYLINGGAIVDVRFELRFYEGTDQDSMGTILPEVLFRTSGGPALDRIPSWIDPSTGEPGLMRVSVDYDAQTYNVVGLYEDPPGSGKMSEQQISDVDQPIGTALGRRAFSLPSGKVGVEVRIIDEVSICDGGDPKAGPVLAGGGAGNEDGMHIVGASTGCDPPEYSLVCDDFGWDPTQNDVCTGGDLCALDLPRYGIALTLYTGPNEDKGGNNEIDTADPVTVGPPDPCTSGLVTVNGFIGDNGQPIASDPVRFFDCDKDDSVDFADFACLQRCFGSDVPSACRVHDHDANGDVDLDDFQAFLLCSDDPTGMDCVGEIPPAIEPLRDVDIYRVTGLVSGQVLSAFVEGQADGDAVPLWDPYLRVFVETVSGVVEMARCDDYYRFNLDALQTLEVPAGVDTVYIGVSSAANAGYDPQDPTSIVVVGNDDAGGYALSVAVTDPACVTDDGSGGHFDCYETKHEPDDTLADADAIGPTASTIIVGAIGDGAFTGLGQDIDIYRIELDDDPLAQTAGVMSITATVKNLVGQGFQTAFDLALALYDSDGNLIATGDQSSELGGLDQTRPKLGANVCGSDVVDCATNPSPEPGVYYLVIFGTDRVAFDQDGSPLPVAIPPTVLNFPHAADAGCTNDCDIRPTLGGRVNRPGAPLEGRVPPNPNSPPNGPTLQCYRIQISTCTNGSPFCQGFTLPQGGPADVDELEGPNGNDSIPDASTSIVPGDRLADAPVELRVLGNGPYARFSGDVDFYAVPADAGQIVSLNIADNLQPPGNSDNRVRSYLAIFGPDGCPFALEDYALERYDSNFFVLDNISDELAATVVSEVPESGTGIAFPMVAIDAGSLDPAENTPFDAFTPGTTLSRRFETQIQQARRYDIAITVMDPVVPLADGLRMFAVTHRGIDEMHTEPFVAHPPDGGRDNYPPILELDPWTGETLALLDGGQFFATWREPMGICTNPDGCPQAVSSNPVLAFDGQSLYVSVERCVSGPTSCGSLSHPLFRINPDLHPGTLGFVTVVGNIEGLAFDAALKGLAESGDLLYAFDTETNTIRYWAKDSAPSIGNGGASDDLTLLSGTDSQETEFDNLDGDLGTDGVSVYAGCSLDGSSIGVCVFDVIVSPDGTDVVFTFAGVVDDPLTNDGLVPGPRLGGLDLIHAPSVMITSDRNGPIVQYWEMTSDRVRALELPRGFVIDRHTAR